ncbi:hypothetical protein [Aquitalea aquatica]|uniref:Fimbrial protein n=1 Tax=Aquitalea aquatica TaxID=3044273 RepID=A0A838Y4S5_9NEIS|nr:hypothetical protein [Aquitalea magnusonii]MBA4710403.1 hypothetical protein [Aquitalea magnusonii]
MHHKHRSKRLFRLAGGLVCCLLAASTHGAEMNISAVFQPSVLAPQTVQFQNTTPLASFCSNFPSNCTGKNFGINFPVRWTYHLEQGGLTDPRKNAYIKVPNTFRQVQLFNTSTGQASQLRFRVSGIATTYNLSKRAMDIVGESGALGGHLLLWLGGFWGNPYGTLGRCVSLGSTLFSDKWATAVWGVPENAGYCYKRSEFSIPAPGLVISDPGLMYELETPNPLELSNGEYRGSLEYHIGPGQDFDFGDNATVDTSSIKINFSLRVAHELKVNYPENAHRVLLEPAGGWAVWLQQGRDPGPLQRDIPFTVTSSGSFSVKLDCQYKAGSHCGIANDRQQVVPVSTALSMEGLRVKNSNQDAANIPLRNDSAVVFATRAASATRRSRLHFTVAAPDVSAMAKQSGDRFLGAVTLVFDAGVI